MVVDSLKRLYGLRDVFCWHGLSLYWSGVSTEEAAVAKYKSRLVFSEARACSARAGRPLGRACPYLELAVPDNSTITCCEGTVSFGRLVSLSRACASCGKHSTECPHIFFKRSSSSD